MKLAKWTMLHPRMTHAMLGSIPLWLDEDNPEPAWKQINQNYGHGGGWSPSPSLNEKTTINLKTLTYKYPGDPPQLALAKCQLRDETIVFYPHSFVAIIQKDGSFEMARVD